MKKVSVILLVLFAAMSNIAFAQQPAVVTNDKPGWRKIGEIKANLKTENESIVILGKDEFKAVKLKVTDAPIKIDKMSVYYESGAIEEVPVRSDLQAGAETKSHDLKFPNEEINKVTFVYKSQPNYQGEKAHVELWGLK